MCAHFMDCTSDPNGDLVSVLEFGVWIVVTITTLFADIYFQIVVF